jgi:hypothetical protein
MTRTVVRGNNSTGRSSHPTAKHVPFPHELSDFLSLRTLTSDTPRLAWAFRSHHCSNAGPLLVLIKCLVVPESRWVPCVRDCNLYIRLMLISPHSSLGVPALCRTVLYVIVSPMGPYIRAAGDDRSSVRGFQLESNYALEFNAWHTVVALGY